jgi:hypothetical protein
MAAISATVPVSGTFTSSGSANVLQELALGTHWNRRKVSLYPRTSAAYVQDTGSDGGAGTRTNTLAADTWTELAPTGPSLFIGSTSTSVVIEYRVEERRAGR